MDMKALIDQSPRLLYGVVAAPLLARPAKYPRLHRKVAKPLLSGPLRGQLIEKIMDNIYMLERNDLSHEDFLRRVTSNMCEAVHRGDIDRWLDLPIKSYENIDVVLCKNIGYAPLKRWYLKLHFMAEDNVHDLHAHRDVLSTQVIARGKLRVQEFDLLEPLKSNTTKIKLARDEDVGPVTGFITTNNYRNIHGFYPVGGPAVRFQFYLRGHTSLKDRLFPKRGRLYVHPNWEARSGDILTAKIGEAGKPGES
jgi:hypothetical protein